MKFYMRRGKHKQKCRHSPSAHAHCKISLELRRGSKTNKEQSDRLQKPDYLRQYSRGFQPDSVFAHNPECNKPGLVQTGRFCFNQVRDLAKY